MKFRVSVLVIVAIMMMPSSAGAKKIIQFGLRGGLNLTNMNFNENPVTSSNTAGFYLGPTIKFTVPVIGIGLDASAVYDQRGCEIDGTKVTNKNLAIPINLRYEIGLSQLACIILKAGPQFSFNVGDKNFSELTNYENYKLSDSNFSVNVGGGVILFENLEASVTYNIACGKTGEGVKKNVDEAFRTRANSWQIGICYYF